LTELNCSSNPLLSTLDLSNNTNLIELWCYSNPLLTSLDLSNNTALELFYGPETPFTSLDFSENIVLTVVNCSYNPLLTSLNVKNGNNASIIGFDARNCFGLDCIQVDDETAANDSQTPYTNWIKDVSTIYSEDCTALDLEDNQFGKSISMYPNPVTYQLTINSKIPLKKVEIYSILGHKVKEVHSDFTSIETNNLSIGMYLVRILSETGTAVKKLIKI